MQRTERAAGIVLCLWAGFWANLCSAESRGASFETVRQMALELAREPYREEAAELPASLAELDYDGYRAIEFDHGKAVWQDEDVPFRLEFFMRGYLYREGVEVYTIENGGIKAAAFRPEMFLYERGRPEGLEYVSGFGGLRITHRGADDEDFWEAASFLGASYFRAIPRGGIYGASARGIAIDTSAAGKTEEFPRFTKLWVERPEGRASRLVMYALLDGPSVAGAYQFEISPGEETVISVRASVFSRKLVTAFGLSPLTSMFLYGEDGEGGPAHRDRRRPEVHDSDGLLMKTNAGEWLWRPLHNPMQNLFSSFDAGGNVGGFGLLQRDRTEKHYKDPRTSPQKRPSIWVEPVGQWPSGKVELLELASKGEGMDNIVAQYILENSPVAGEELTAEYRLRFYSTDKRPHELGYVVSTQRKKTDDGGIAYTIEFEGTEAAGVEPAVMANGAEVSEAKVDKAGKDVIRLRFNAAAEDGQETVELRAFLSAEGKAVTETWSEQWRP